MTRRGLLKALLGVPLAGLAAARFGEAPAPDLTGYDLGAGMTPIRSPFPVDIVCAICRVERPDAPQRFPLGGSAESENAAIEQAALHFLKEHDEEFMMYGFDLPTPYDGVLNATGLTRPRIPAMLKDVTS